MPLWLIRWALHSPSRCLFVPQCRRLVGRSGRLSCTDPAPGIGHQVAGDGVAANGFGCPDTGGAEPKRAPMPEEPAGALGRWRTSADWGSGNVEPVRSAPRVRSGSLLPSGASLLERATDLKVAGDAYLSECIVTAARRWTIRKTVDTVYR